MVKCSHFFKPSDIINISCLKQHHLSASVSGLGSKNFSNILVGIDGSEQSFKAANYALSLAKSFGAKLTAVTVSYVPASENLSQSDVLRQSLIEDKSDYTKDTETWFETLVHDAKASKIQLETELLNSTRPVDYVILEYAEEKEMDLIVVGTKGRSGFRKLLLGSVASSIMTYSHCPVLIIK
ncbi:MAG: universal stress protein [Candidatus Eiseniibacteriota bacterium]